MTGRVCAVDKVRKSPSYLLNLLILISSRKGELSLACRFIVGVSRSEIRGLSVGHPKG